MLRQALQLDYPAEPLEVRSKERNCVLTIHCCAFSNLIFEVAFRRKYGKDQAKGHLELLQMHPQRHELMLPNVAEAPTTSTGAS